MKQLKLTPWSRGDIWDETRLPACLRRIPRRKPPCCLQLLGHVPWSASTDPRNPQGPVLPSDNHGDSGPTEKFDRNLNLSSRHFKASNVFLTEPFNPRSLYVRPPVHFPAKFSGKINSMSLMSGKTSLYHGTPWLDAVKSDDVTTSRDVDFPTKYNGKVIWQHTTPQKYLPLYLEGKNWHHVTSNCVSRRHAKVYL